jgi:hypothetical protein
MTGKKEAVPKGAVVVYDGLAEKQQTFLFERCTKHKDCATTIDRAVKPGDKIDVGDLEDGSDRSRMILGHLARGVCHYVES